MLSPIDCLWRRPLSVKEALSVKTGQFVGRALSRSCGTEIRIEPYGIVRMSADECVHVVDDDAAVRDSLDFLLSSAGFAVRTYASGNAFLIVAPTIHTGCVLTDLRMPDIDGLTLQKRLTTAGCVLPVIVMTGHGDVPLAVAAMKAGAVDFLEKPFDDDSLLRAIGTALTANRRAREDEHEIAAIQARFGLLTKRERDVMAGLVEGLPNKTIAFDLGTSPRTVEVQRARVMEKMHAHSVADLVRMSIRARWDHPQTGND